MSQWLKSHAHEHGYRNLVFVMANTGQENEQTLEFADRCDRHFGLDLHYVEAVVHHNQRKSSTHMEVGIRAAARNGEPFEQMIRKYGIPNKAFPHCTRELKENPIRSFGREYFHGEKYHTAIGIRVDEIDRVSSKAKKMGLVYPLAQKEMLPTSKPVINLYWDNMPFRLELKGYEGNCMACWKKSDLKLRRIAADHPERLRFTMAMEMLYSMVGPEFEKYETTEARRFFRGKRSAADILMEARDPELLREIEDDSQIMPDEACEVFSMCGDD